MKTCKVVTWQSPCGGTIDVTPAQEKIARKMGKWPRTTSGEEYCTVSRGLHHGAPTFHLYEWQEILAGRKLK